MFGVQTPSADDNCVAKWTTKWAFTFVLDVRSELWNSRWNVVWIKRCIKLWLWQAISSPSLHVWKAARNTANHRRQGAHPVFVFTSVPIAQPGTVSSSAPLQDSRSAMWQRGSHCILGETLLWSPSGHNPSPPLTILPGLLQKFLCPPGHRTAQNNRTHQHFHLHPWASSDTAAAAVRPLAGTDSSEKY